MIRSLRWRILVGTSLTSSVILAAIGVVLYSTMRRALIADFDSSSLVQAKALAGMTEFKHRGLRFDADGVQPQFAAKHDPLYFELFTDSGTAVAKSGSLGAAHLQIESTAAAPTGQPGYADLLLPDGRHGRGIAMRFVPQQDNDDEEDNAPANATRQTATVVFARGTETLDETLARLRRLLAMVFGMAIVVSGGVLSAVVAHSTRPLRRLAGDIDSIRADDLSLRVVADSVPSELRPVVDRLNELLARLDRAFARERAFTADVAHELRTPIAGLHTTLEVCRSRPRSTADYETAIDKCLRMSEGIGSMIRTLLLMGRADAGQLVADRSDVELVALLEGCWAPFAHRATAKSAVVECDIKTVRLETDVEKLKMLVNNLLDNAVSYVDEAGRIEIAGKLDGPSVVISISNTGSTIAPDQIPLLTERFWRGDSSRSATGLHCGLGLTLCDRLVGLIGGRLAFSSINGVFTAVVRLTQPGAAGNHDGPNLVGETRSPVHTA